MRAIANTRAFTEEEVDVEKRLAVLESDVASIKVTLTRISEKVDAANDALFGFREEVQRSFRVADTELRKEIKALAVAQEKMTGEWRTALEKAVGTLGAMIEKNAGEQKVAIERMKVWWLLLAMSILGGSLYFVVRAFKWI